MFACKQLCSLQQDPYQDPETGEQFSVWDPVSESGCLPPWNVRPPAMSLLLPTLKSILGIEASVADPR